MLKFAVQVIILLQVNSTVHFGPPVDEILTYNVYTISDLLAYSLSLNHYLIYFQIPLQVTVVIRSSSSSIRARIFIVILDDKTDSV